MAETLAADGYRIVSGGTDTHLMLVDVFAKGMLGSEAEKALARPALRSIKMRFRSIRILR